MRANVLIVVILLVAAVAYALDRGVFVGSRRYVMGATATPYLDVIQKECSYLFITGISEFNAPDGQVMAPDAMKNSAAEAAGWAKPDNGYCHIFAR